MMAVPPKIKKVWRSIDAWRGKYTYEVDPKDKDRARIIDLAYIARDPKENEEYLNTTIDLLRKAGFNVHKKFLQTSNVFATNVALIVFKDRPFTDKEKEFLDEFEDVYVDKYNLSFSIFTGETRPIDVEGFVNTVKELYKKKLGEVL
jgi:hypothetical protein